MNGFSLDQRCQYLTAEGYTLYCQEDGSEWGWYRRSWDHEQPRRGIVIGRRHTFSDTYRSRVACVRAAERDLARGLLGEDAD